MIRREGGKGGGSGRSRRGGKDGRESERGREKGWGREERVEQRQSSKRDGDFPLPKQVNRASGRAKERAREKAREGEGLREKRIK